MRPEDYIDLATFYELQDTMGADFVAEIIDTYSADTADVIVQLGEALDANDASTFGRLAHSLKSTSASLGALTFAQQARELEMIGKAGDLYDAGPRLDQLAEDFEYVRWSLEALRDGA